MKRCFLSFVLFIISVSLSAQAEEWLWAIGTGGTGNDYAQAIATDADKNSYVTGEFEDTACFGNTNLTSSGGNDIFVTKLDTSGNWIWASGAGGTGADSGKAIAIDSEGNCYVSGSFEGTISFGSISLTSSGYEDIFIAKLDTNGNWLWASGAGGTLYEGAYSIAIDGEGNCYVCGYFYGTTSFNNISLDSSGISDIFVAKLGMPDYQVLVPNGSESWYADTMQTVYWSSNSSSYLNVHLSLDNGLSWILLNTDPVLASLGSFSFTVPQVSSENCLIKVENAEYSSCLDYCDGWFSIIDKALPLELSSFTTTITADNFVQINWITGSETGLSGYRIYRNSSNEQSSAICISLLINAYNYSYQHNYSYLDNDVDAGWWYYWLEALEWDGSQYLFGPLFVSLSNLGLEPSLGTPLISGIKSIYPNPFNPNTTITIELSKPSHVQMGIYNLKGELVRSLYSGNKDTGTYHIAWDGINNQRQTCGSGIYIIKLRAEGKSTQAKLTLMR
ncbi:MAG: T9SS type A sorting domain-containing protein [Candidatus Cloacimonetes bacterium]|jgi:hypothetical protein|nr:T9SS type A sorting domain-containing protein [Candidatus Cloacimonadota bacterium]